MPTSSNAENVSSAPRDWLIRKSGYFYRPDRAGYTSSVHEAGRYTEAEAKAEASVEPYITAHRAADWTGSAESLTDDYLRQVWRHHGGRFHGPNVETGTMPEALLLPFLRSLMVQR